MVEQTAGATDPRKSPPRPTLRSGIGWSFVGTAAFSAGQWAVIVVLARLGDPTMVGQYALGLAVSAPVVLLANLALRTVYVTDAAGRFDFADYLGLRIGGMLLAVGVIAGVGAFIGQPAAMVIVLAGTAKALDGIGDIFHGLFQRQHRMRPIAISLIINAVTTVAATLVLLSLTGSVVWATAGTVVGSVLGAVVYCGVAAGPMLRWRASRRPRRAVASLIVVALPLGLASAVTAVTANLPYYLLGRVDVAALGTFAALAAVIVASYTVLAPIGQVMLPRMAALFAGGEFAALASLTNRLVLGALVVGGVLTGLTGGFGRWVLDIVYGASYTEHGHVLTILVIAATATGMVYFVSTALSAARRFGNQQAASGVTLVVTAGFGTILVPRFELAGAAWLAVLAMAVDGTLKAIMLRRVLTGRSRS